MCEKIRKIVSEDNPLTQKEVKAILEENWLFRFKEHKDRG